MASKECSMNKVTKTIVTSPAIYKPVGPYSQAILADKTLYVSGVLGMDPSAKLVPGGAEAETRQALENLKHILEAGGACLESVIKTTILLGDIQDFKTVNQVYSEYFAKDCPARATFQVGKLPAGALVEIEAIALSGDLVIAEAGPQAILAENMLYVTGLRGLDPQDQLAVGGAAGETRQVLENLKQILETAGAGLEDVVKTTIYLSDIRDLKIINGVYEEYFPEDYPASAMYQVGRLPGALGPMVPILEIDAIAYVGQCVMDAEDEGPPVPCICPSLYERKLTKSKNSESGPQTPTNDPIISTPAVSLKSHDEEET